jgi:hypothetical protein
VVLAATAFFYLAAFLGVAALVALARASRRRPAALSARLAPDAPLDASLAGAAPPPGP